MPKKNLMTPDSLVHINDSLVHGIPDVVTIVLCVLALCAGPVVIGAITVGMELLGELVFSVLEWCSGWWSRE